jgi:hypothetical protein
MRNVLSGFAEFWGAPVLMAVISALYFAAGKGTPSTALRRRILSSAHGAVAAVLYLASRCHSYCSTSFRLA